MKNVIDTYNWNWIDDWDTYSIYYDEATDSIKASMTSSSRFGGSEPCERITQEITERAVIAWKRQYMERVINDHVTWSIFPSEGKEVEVNGYSRGAKVAINGQRGIVIWQGTRRKFQFRDYTYDRDYMNEEVVKIDINGTIYWIPTTKITVVNPEQYWVTSSKAEEMTNIRIAERGITWHSVIQHNGNWVMS